MGGGGDTERGSDNGQTLCISRHIFFKIQVFFFYSNYQIHCAALAEVNRCSFKRSNLPYQPLGSFTANRRSFLSYFSSQ